MYHPFSNRKRATKANRSRRFCRSLQKERQEKFALLKRVKVWFTLFCQKISDSHEKPKSEFQALPVIWRGVCRPVILLVNLVRRRECFVGLSILLVYAHRPSQCWFSGPCCCVTLEKERRRTHTWPANRKAGDTAHFHRTALQLSRNKSADIYCIYHPFSNDICITKITDICICNIMNTCITLVCINRMDLCKPLILIKRIIVHPPLIEFLSHVVHGSLILSLVNR